MLCGCAAWEQEKIGLISTTTSLLANCSQYLVNWSLIPNPFPLKPPPQFSSIFFFYHGSLFKDENVPKCTKLRQKEKEITAIFFFLAAPVVYRNSLTRDRTCTSAVTHVAAVTMLDPGPTELQENSHSESLSHLWMGKTF